MSDQIMKQARCQNKSLIKESNETTKDANEDIK